MGVALAGSEASPGLDVAESKGASAGCRFDSLVATCGAIRRTDDKGNLGCVKALYGCSAVAPGARPKAPYTRNRFGALHPGELESYPRVTLVPDSSIFKHD